MQKSKGFRVGDMIEVNHDFDPRDLTLIWQAQKFDVIMRKSKELPRFWTNKCSDLLWVSGRWLVLEVSDVYSVWTPAASSALATEKILLVQHIGDWPAVPFGYTAWTFDSDSWRLLVRPAEER